MVMEKLLELIEPPALLALITVTPKTPAVVGVPESSPVTLLSVNPGGNTPEARLYAGAGKPFAENVKLYGVPTTPLTGAAVNTVGAPITLMVAGAELIAPAILLARMTMPLYVPPMVGVPISCPVAAFKNTPGGNVPAKRLYVGAGKPLAV